MLHCRVPAGGLYNGFERLLKRAAAVVRKRFAIYCIRRYTMDAIVRRRWVP